MKKYLMLAVYTVLYFVVLVGLVFAAAFSWWKFVKVDFLVKNFNLSSFLGFLFVIIVYSIILKVRKINLIKECNFARISLKNLGNLTITGIIMGIFTCCVCNTSLVITKMKVLRDYIAMVEGGSNPFWFYMITIAFIFVCEEIMFRGTIFNEMRRNISLGWAIFFSTAVYGGFNIFTQGWTVGTYAYMAALFYTFAYVYLRSLWAPITLQIASMYTISIFRKVGIWDRMTHWGDTVMAITFVLSAILIFVFYYFFYLEYKKTGTKKKVALTA